MISPAELEREVKVRRGNGTLIWSKKSYIIATLSKSFWFVFQTP